MEMRESYKRGERVSVMWEGPLYGGPVKMEVRGGRAAFAVSEPTSPLVHLNRPMSLREFENLTAVGTSCVGAAVGLNMGGGPRVRGCPFSSPNPHTLQLDVHPSSSLLIKFGSMIALKGNITLTRKTGISITSTLFMSIGGEGACLLEVKGSGSLWAADQRKKVIILYLNNESIVINGSDILAMESSLTWRYKVMRMGAMLQGGMLNVRVEGRGYVAVTSHGDPMCLEVTPEDPVHTDPKATVLWSGDLDPVLQSTFSINYFLGGRTGEEFQLRFSNAPGFVVVQPFEEYKFGTRHRHHS